MYLKSIFLIFLSVLCSGLLFAQDLPQPSPAAKVEQRIGLTDVVVKYARPSIKGRKVWGDLVPYNQVWRTGANASTLISFSEEVIIKGQKLPKGEYALFCIPTDNEWTVIFNKNLTLWGADGYKQEEDVLRVNLKPSFNNPHVESFLIAFDQLQLNSGELILMWEKMRLSIPIETDASSKAFANIEKAIAELDRGFRVYNTSASYLLDANQEPAKALEYAQKSVAMREVFWNVYTLSRAHAANKQYKEALAAAEKSLKLSKEAKYEPYVKMNEENIAQWKKLAK